jgi:hypothetical protein
MLTAYCGRCRRRWQPVAGVQKVGGEDCAYCHAAGCHPVSCKAVSALRHRCIERPRACGRF